MLFYLLPIVGFLALITRTIHIAYKPSLRDIPGPWLAKFTDLYRMYYGWRGDNHKTMRALHKKYGSLVRIGPNCVLLSQKGQFEKIFGFKEDYIKSDAMKVWQTLYNGKPVPSMVSTQSKRIHGEIKKPVAAIYSMTNVMTYESGVDDIIKYFLQRLDEMFINGQTGEKPCDIDNWVQYFAFDVIGEITLNRRLGFLETGTDVDNMLAQLNSEFDYRVVIGPMPWLDKWLAKNPVYLWLLKPNNPFMARAKALIQDRLKHGKGQSDKTDFMDRFLEAKKTYPNTVTDPVLSSYVATNLLAGSDTTACVLRSILYYVMKTPNVLQQLRKELDESGTDYPVPFKTAQGLPYLDAVIRESMRIHFIGSFPFERVVPKQGHELPNGMILPAGTIVSMSPWTLHFDQTIFGKDAEVFNPDRWLQDAGESEEDFHVRLASMKHNEFSFSYGPRVCLGRHLATMEMYKVVPTLLCLLDMELVDPEKDWKVEGLFFTRQSEMDMNLTWRKGFQREHYIH